MIIKYLIIINIISFCIMGIDKYLSKSKSRRISEKTLFVLALIYGSIGSIIGMYTFRHKTKKWYFTIMMPIILILQIISYAQFLSKIVI